MKAGTAFLKLLLWVVGHGHSPALPVEIGPADVGHAVHARAPRHDRRHEPASGKPSGRSPWVAPPASQELAFNPADLYFPRFDTGNPEDSLEFDLRATGSILAVGRWTDAGFTSDRGTVSRVSFYEAPAETVAVREWSEVTWRPLGDGKFNEVSGRWELPFTPPAGDPYKAHVFVAEFHDLAAPAEAGQLLARAFGINPEAPMSDPPSAVAPVSVRMWPSPARAGASVTIELASTAGREDGFEIGIYDVAGRRVAVVGKGLSATPSRAARVTWNGRDSNGSPAAPAVYFVMANRSGERHPAQGQLVVVP